MTERLYENADNCPHPEPDTSSGTDEAWEAWDRWSDDHSESPTEDVDRVCLLSPLEDVTP